MLRVARLDGVAFQELRNDKEATGQAVTVVFLVSLSYGIGFSVFSGFKSGVFALDKILIGVLTHTILSLLAVLLWTIVTFLIGTKLFQGKTLFWEHARPFFFSTTPGLLFVLISVPYWLVYASVTAVLIWWIVICEVMAAKNSMRFKGSSQQQYFRTLLTFTVGFLVLILISGFIA